MMNDNNVVSTCHKDYFTQLEGREYAGKHILIDIWGADNLDDSDLLSGTLKAAVDAAGATLLHLHIHQFTSTGGLSGAAILAESHINAHTWPERGFATFDAFMCGSTRPERVEAVIKEAYSPKKLTVEWRYRGEVKG